MATVKGDVHDIGKNIVGVVLACNDFDVIDLGVMVPAHQILDTAVERDADMIGLSGLITPSLDEMCTSPPRWSAAASTLPLLIGGATTSKVHTAVKIDPCYSRGQTVYVPDASRAVGVASALLDAEQRAALSARGQGRVPRDRRTARQRARRRPPGLAASRRARTACGSTGTRTRRRRPRCLGRAGRSTSYDLGELARYIDWTPFFRTWELKGTFPKILDDPTVGPRRASLYDDAQAMLERIVDERWVTRQAVVGLWPAEQPIGDDIVVYADEERERQLATLHTLRQQLARDREHPNLALADFVAPLGPRRRPTTSARSR